MKKREVKNLGAGDYIRCRHNLGSGHIVRIALTEDEDTGVPIGKYPMFQYEDDVTGALKWCTYVIVEYYLIQGDQS